MDRLDRLRDAIAEKQRVLVLFSGGLDSTVLAQVAQDVLGDDSCALTFTSTIIPRHELVDARDIAARIGIRHVVMEMNELDDPVFASNPPDRCYRCRKMRDARAIGWARDNGFPVVADGLNASDLADYRPGMQAAREDGIWQPFTELDIIKDEIRAMAREMGLPLWDRPNTVCLSSRIPYGDTITQEMLQRVDRAEEYLRGLGFRQVRVRHFPRGIAVVEVEAPDRVLGHGEEIVGRLRELGFALVTLDLEGFESGKMNRLLDRELVQS